MRSNFSPNSILRTAVSLITRTKHYCTQVICCTAAEIMNLVYCMYVCMVITYSKGKKQTGKLANSARGQLNREN